MIRFKKDIRPYNCFSNFYPCTVVVDGMQFRSAEAAFQAQKVPLEKRRDFIFCTPSAAKHLGRHVPLPADWDDVRDEAMHKVVYAKFSKNENLRQISIVHRRRRTCRRYYRMARQHLGRLFVS